MSPPFDASSTLRSEQVALDDVVFHSGTDTYRTEYDFQTRPASLAVIEAVAAAADSDPLDLPRLHSIVDPDSLDTLFCPTTAGQSRGEGNTSFNFADHRVTVHSYGIVEVKPVVPDDTQ